MPSLFAYDGGVCNYVVVFSANFTCSTTTTINYAKEKDHFSLAFIFTVCAYSNTTVKIVVG